MKTVQAFQAKDGSLHLTGYEVVKYERELDFIDNYEDLRKKPNVTP